MATQPVAFAAEQEGRWSGVAPCDYRHMVSFEFGWRNPTSAELALFKVRGLIRPRAASSFPSDARDPLHHHPMHSHLLSDLEERKRFRLFEDLIPAADRDPVLLDGQRKWLGDHGLACRAYVSTPLDHQGGSTSRDRCLDELLLS